MSKVNDTKVEGALVKLRIVRLAIRALAEQDPSVGGDLFSVIALLDEVKDELEGALKGES